MDENSPEKKDSLKETAVDYEKRFKDTQAELTKKAQELSEEKSSHDKDKELLEQVSQFVDWDAASGKKPAQEEEFMTDAEKKLSKSINELKTKMRENQAIADFRTKFSDMVDYEDMVMMYMSKTDPRNRLDTRVKKAVELTRNFLDRERGKAKDVKEEEIKEKISKEAEASGLETSSGGEKEEEHEETYEEHLAWRKEQRRKGMELSPAIPQQRGLRQ